MAQGLLESAQALATALAADVELASWATTHFAKPLTVFKGRAAGPANEDELPAVSVDAFRGTNEIQTLGAGRSEKRPDLELVFSWKEGDALKAFTQRLSLPDVVGRFAMRGTNKTLGGACGAMTVDLNEDAITEDGVFVQTYAVSVVYQLKP